MESGSGQDRGLAHLLEFAVKVAQAAGTATLQHFGDRVTYQSKEDGTPVTLADAAAERVLRSRIRERFPHDGILGEEEGEEPGSSGYRWILDPIDGTRSFMRGVPLYAVLVGLERAGDPVLGVIHLPALGETVSAAAGQGCYRDGVRCRVNQVHDLQQAVALTSDPGMTLGGEVGPGWDALTGRVDYTRSWGDAYGHALVASGRAEIMLDPPGLAAWDAAPLLPILTEAGGRFTSADGRATIHGGSGLSTNGVLHDRVLALLNDPQA